MATKKTELVKARVLVAGHYGEPDAVVELSADQLKQAKHSGQVDDHPDAVAYAETLRAPEIK